jgi:hypothetical protein
VSVDNCLSEWSKNILALEAVLCMHDLLNHSLGLLDCNITFQKLVNYGSCRSIFIQVHFGQTIMNFNEFKGPDYTYA